MEQDQPVAQLGEAILRGPMRDVTDVTDPEVKKVIKDLMDIVKPAKGVGIAANQVRSDLKIFVLASHPNERYPYAPEMEPFALINPKLIAHSEEKEKDWEGCLSVATCEFGKRPAIYARVPRYTWVEVEYTDENGEIKQDKFEGFVARVFQHEYDHLQGLVYLDRVEDNKDIYSQQEFMKLVADRKSDNGS